MKKDWTSGQNYHVCEVLKIFTREIYGCIAIGLVQKGWYRDQNLEIFRSIGAILNRILVINQLLSSLIQAKAISWGENFQGINFYIKSKYDFDIDEVWKTTEEMIEQSNTDINSLLIKDRKAYINSLYTLQPSDITLSNLYVDIYNLLNHSKPSTVNINPMVELSLNGLYLGKLMEMELDRMYAGGKIKIDEKFLKFLISERRPKFFESVISTCRRNEEQSVDVLMI